MWEVYLSYDNKHSFGCSLMDSNTAALKYDHKPLIPSKHKEKHYSKKWQKSSIS